MKKINLKSKIVNMKEYIKKLSKNYRWEVRYNNLNKKYEEAKQEIERLKKELDSDENILKIKDKNKYIKKLQNQRKILREEIKKYNAI